MWNNRISINVSSAEFGQFKSGVLFDGVGRNAALTTVPATTTSVETTAAEEISTKGK